MLKKRTLYLSLSLLLSSKKREVEIVIIEIWDGFSTLDPALQKSNAIKRQRCQI